VISVAWSGSNVKVMVSSEFDARGITQAEKEFRRAHQMQSRAATEMARVEERAAAQRREAINTTANAMGALGLAMVAVAGLAVAKSAEFSAAMSNVAATGVSRLDELRAAAMQAGRDTAYTAIEAAQGIEQMAKAGVAAEDVLSGGLTATLDLAAAGQLEVARAAEITAITLKQFALSGQDATKVADLLSAGANKAVGGVEELAQGLAYVGPVAAQMGVSLEETTGTLAMFAEQGILGQKAGTGLRGVLMSMTAPSAAATRAMEEYGISVFDAQGEFIGLEGVAGQLKDQFGAMDEATRSAALGQIFGNEQITAARVLYQNGAEGVREWTEAVDESGYAAQVAADRLDNLQGDVKILRGSLETLLISLGEGGQGPLRGLTQSVTEVVNALAEMPEEAQSALLAIVGGGGLALVGVAGVAKLTLAVSRTITQLKLLSTTAKLTGGVAAGALALGTIALMAWASQAADARARTQELQGTLDEFGRTTGETLSAINDALSTDRGGFLDGIFGKDPESLIDMGERLGLTVEDLQAAILGEEAAMARVNAATAEYADGHSHKTTEMNNFTKALQAERDALTGAEKAAGQKAIADEAAGISSEDLAASVASATGELQTQAEVIEEAIGLMAELAGVVLSERDAQRGFEESLDSVTEALETNGKTLDITTEAGRANQSALDDVAASGWKLIESMQENDATQSELQATMATSRQAFLDAAAAMGLGAEEANALADEMGLIPENIDVSVEVETAAAERKLRTIQTILAGMKDFVITADVRAQGGYDEHRAGGGPVVAGRPYMVGEREPELFVPDQSGMIYNQAQLAAMGSRAPEAYGPVHNSAQSTTTVYITADVSRLQSVGQLEQFIGNARRLGRQQGGVSA